MKKRKIIKLIALIALSTNISFVSQLAYADAWIKSGQSWMYEMPSGNAIGWKQIKGKWYYFKQNGIMSTGWIKDKETWYYLNSDGDMATGWRNIKNTWYYFDYSGAMKQGWVKDNNKWYFMNNNGAMQTGLIQVNDKIYYLNNSGAMVTGNVNININGIVYNFAESGEALGSNLPKVDKAFDNKGTSIIENNPIENKPAVSNEESISAVTETFEKTSSGGGGGGGSSSGGGGSSSSSGSSSSQGGSSVSGENSPSGESSSSQGESSVSGGNSSSGESSSSQEENSASGGNGSSGGSGSYGNENGDDSDTENTRLNLTASLVTDISNPNGVISGLNAQDRYKYKLRAESSYRDVSENSTKIENLSAGIYDVKSLSDNKIFTITVRNKTTIDNYVKPEDLSQGFISNGNSEINFNNEERIKKAIQKAESGQDVNILLIGGSITYGYSSRTYEPIKNNSYGIQFAKWWEEAFPNSNVNAYDIGIPSSHSAIANARVENEIAKYNPDLVFVDFAVNDGNGYWDNMHYESLLRKILNSSNKPALMLPMFSFFDKDNGYSVTAPVHTEIGNKFNLPMVGYGKIMQSVVSHTDSGNILDLLEKLGYTYNPDDQSGETVHPGDAGHMIMANQWENYVERILNDYNYDNTINEDAIEFDGGCIYGNKYDDEVLLNPDTIPTTDDAVNVTTNQQCVFINGDGFKTYKVNENKRAYPYYDYVGDGGTFYECDTLPCWEGRSSDSEITFTNIKGKSIGVWCYYHLECDSNIHQQHQRKAVQGGIKIEAVSDDGEITIIDRYMPYHDGNMNSSAYAFYTRIYGEGDGAENARDEHGNLDNNSVSQLNGGGYGYEIPTEDGRDSTNNTQKKFNKITIKPTGSDPNIQILGLVVSGTDEAE